VTIALSFGKYGGFYAHFSGAAWRVCLGWMALTVLFMDLDNWLEEWLDRAEQRQAEDLVSQVLDASTYGTDATEATPEHPPAVVCPGWKMPSHKCSKCDAQLAPMAINTGSEWYLSWDFCDECDDDSAMCEDIEWPFVENWATGQDLARLGFRIE